MCLCVRVIFEGIKLLLMSTAWWRLLWFHPVTHTRLGTSSPIGRTKAPTRKNTKLVSSRNEKIEARLFPLSLFSSFLSSFIVIHYFLLSVFLPILPPSGNGRRKTSVPIFSFLPNPNGLEVAEPCILLLFSMWIERMYIFKSWNFFSFQVFRT